MRPCAKRSTRRKPTLRPTARSLRWSRNGSARGRGCRDKGKSIRVHSRSSLRRLLFAWAVIGLDPVAVRIDDEGRIVIVAVDLPQTGRAVVLPARLVRG